MSQKTTYRVLTILAIVAILLTGCGGGKKSLKDQVLGKWECNAPELNAATGGAITFEFLKDGKAKLSLGPATIDITYKWPSDKTIEITIDMSMGTGDPTVQAFDASITGDKLSLTAEGQTIECTKK